MSDPFIFAVLTACDKSGRAAAAFKLPENRKYHRKARPDIAEEPTIGSRESTPAPERDAEANAELGDRLILRFDDKLKDITRGWQFGTDPKSCDILLGHRGTPGISAKHLSITVTRMKKVELYNESKFGTVVSYNGQSTISAFEGDKRMLSLNLEKYRDWATVKVFVPYENKLTFTISFPRRKESQLQYLQNLRTFVQKREKAYPMISQLGLSDGSPTTPGNRKLQSLPRESIIYRGKELGRGTFSRVYQCIDVTDGEMYAVKLFTTKFQRTGNTALRHFDEQKWLERIQREVTIMKNNPHPHVMQVKNFVAGPTPSLFMPLYRLGSLKDCTEIERSQHPSIYQQALLGLAHLHGRGITHRDLKPYNILVTQLKPLHIVLSDFGASKATAENELMLTYCGTSLYNAPEILRDGNRGTRKGYDSSIDIWALGVTMFEMSFGLPDRKNLTNVRPDGHSQSWSMLIISKINKTRRNCDKLIDLIAQMVVHQPSGRLTADQCLRQGFESGLFSSVDKEDLYARRSAKADATYQSEACCPGVEPSEVPNAPRDNNATRKKRCKRPFDDAAK